MLNEYQIPEGYMQNAQVNTEKEQHDTADNL